MINDWIKALRRAADALEDVLAFDPASRPRAARAIANRVAANLTGSSSPVRRGGGPLGFKYKPGTHWTQTARGREILSERQRAKAARLGPGHASSPVRNKGGAQPGKLHWTQKPENRARLARQMKKAAQASVTKRKQKGDA